MNFSIFLENKFPKTLSINVGTRHSFSSFSKIKAWIEKEKQFYKSIQDPNRNISNLNSLLRTIENEFTSERYFLPRDRLITLVIKKVVLIDLQ